jgi:glycosyltransferase involved in cell wall biosynthesis
MKLVYIHQYFKFPSEQGGTRSYDLATQFVNSGIEVEIITSTSKQEFASECRWTRVAQSGLIVHYMYLPYNNHFSYLKRNLVFLKFLWFSTLKVLSINCDLVLATSTPLTIGIPALLKKWFSNSPYIFEVRDVWPEAVIAIGAIKNKFVQKALFLLESKIYKNADALVPLSVDMKYSIESRFPELKSKIPLVVIENISEIDRFQSDLRSNESLLRNSIGFVPRFSVLYAGTFGRVNGLEYVLELAAKTWILDQGLVFILFGNGVQKKDILQKAKDKGVFSKNVFILEPMSKSELPQWYFEVSMGSSFVTPIPELWSNSANKFFDTLAAGKPILVNYGGWQSKVIEDHNVGYRLPLIVTEEAAKDFVAYTMDSDLIEHQSRNAIKLANERYSLQIATEKYLAIFDKIKNSV